MVESLCYYTVVPNSYVLKRDLQYVKGYKAVIDESNMSKYDIIGELANEYYKNLSVNKPYIMLYSMLKDAGMHFIAVYMGDSSFPIVSIAFTLDNGITVMPYSNVYNIDKAEAQEIGYDNPDAISIIQNHIQKSIKSYETAESIECRWKD